MCFLLSDDRLPHTALHSLPFLMRRQTDYRYRAVQGTCRDPEVEPVSGKPVAHLMPAHVCSARARLTTLSHHLNAHAGIRGFRLVTPNNEAVLKNWVAMTPVLSCHALRSSSPPCLTFPSRTPLGCMPWHVGGSRRLGHLRLLPHVLGRHLRRPEMWCAAEPRHFVGRLRDDPQRCALGPLLSPGRPHGPAWKPNDSTQPPFFLPPRPRT